MPRGRRVKPNRAGGLTDSARFATALVLAGVILLTALVQWWRGKSAAPGPEAVHPAPVAGSAGVAASPHLFLGNPSGASPDPASRDNLLMVKPQFALSYNDRRGTPNWVAWRLRAADLGDAPRKPQFDPDATLPAGFYRVSHRDYTASGFDRGHLCPHSDRDATEADAFATFVMTNVVPQAPNVNQQAWASLENYCRSLVQRRDTTVYIIAGVEGIGGVGSKGPAETLAHGKVTVPQWCWKVIVVDERSVSSPTELSAGDRVIAVRMPNDESKVDLAWAPFRVSVAEVERATGYRFFDAVPPEVAEAWRKKTDTTFIPAPSVPRYLRDRR